ncbi:MAG: sigma 54-dependent Fis family transcriptional regulator [Candidatus Wallbacteria bacterium]|nr:sigma 54-dependent Fis family transcriptional regulator [Candidatus Wallbacteria bacterium]
MKRAETEKLPPEALEHVTLSLGRGVLVVREGPDAGRSLELSPGGAVRVGTEESSDLALSDPSVSGKHLVVAHRASGFVVRDLESTNGTSVDGVRVTEAFLRPGSRIRAGRTVLEVVESREELAIFPSASGRFGRMSSKSRKMRQLFGLLERVAPSQVDLLIEGETGSGKEVLARSIHESSARAAGPYVVYDCARASREFMESELFGHEKGAFTGAVERRVGAFEAADRGTLFIDEVGELAGELQPKLLRALEEREVRPLGSGRSRAVDVRIVAATNRDLRAMVGECRFREDLYFRLAVMTVQLPPLRERREDLPALARELLSGRGGAAISDEALAVLATQTWRGNIRELGNVLERARALAAGEVIRPAHLLLQGTGGAASREAPADLAGRTLEELEREAIRQTLQACANNKAAAARSLGIASSTLFEKLKRLGLER